MSLTTKPAAFYADFGGLATLKGAARAQDPAALREAARQFESLFTQMMLKTMRQASTAISGGDSLMGNDQSDMYREMFDNQMAAQLAKGRGLGLADMLVRQLTQAGIASDQGKDHNALPLPSPMQNKPESGIELRKAPAATQFPIAVPSAVPAFLKSTAPIQPVVPPIAAQPKPQPTVEAKSSALPAAGTEPVASEPVAVKKEIPRPPSLAKDAADFVRQMWPHAQKAARELGVDAKTLIAHAALETGWGKFVPCNPDGSCSFNLFGIKATGRWQGASTAVNTLEYEDGVAVKKRESFRAYDSPADSFRDYASFIKSSPRYASALGAGGDAAAFASALQQGGYATDPNYATKLTSVASRLSAMAPVRSIEASALKRAENQPLSTGRSVSAGGET